MHEYLARVTVFGSHPTDRNLTDSVTEPALNSLKCKDFTTNCACLICQTTVPEITEATKCVMTADNSSSYKKMHPKNACPFLFKQMSTLLILSHALFF